MEIEDSVRAYKSLIEKQDAMLAEQSQTIRALQSEVDGFHMEVADLLDRIRSLENDVASLRSGIDHPVEHS